jgi:paraquat-inducible protein A
LHNDAASGSQRVRILALCALIFYLPAMTLPMLRVERLGHMRQDSLLGGVENLLSQGYWLVGLVVLLFSVVLPPLKLFALLWLTRPVFLSHPHRALIYRWAERLGRWGMLDVLLVAILIAFVKLGSLVTITAGPGLSAFILLVLCSLLASLAFNPRAMWSTTDS